MWDSSTAVLTALLATEIALAVLLLFLAELDTLEKIVKKCDLKGEALLYNRMKRGDDTQLVITALLATVIVGCFNRVEEKVSCSPRMRRSAVPAAYHSHSPASSSPHPVR